MASDIANKIVTTKIIRNTVSVNGSAKGMPYFEPIKPVLHSSTKAAGAAEIQCGEGLEPGVMVEIVELADHPWFIGVQFHPEFKSRPLDPHPLFTHFVKASLKCK